LRTLKERGKVRRRRVKQELPGLREAWLIEVTGLSRAEVNERQRLIGALLPLTNMKWPDVIFSAEHAQSLGRSDDDLDRERTNELIREAARL
jgi:hypothetical protein